MAAQRNNKGRRGQAPGHSGHPGQSGDRRKRRNLAPDGRKQGLAGKTGAAGAAKAKPKGGKRPGGRRPRPDAHGAPAPRRPSFDPATLIEGRRATDEALAAGLPIQRAFIAVSRGSQDPKLERLARELEADGVEVQIVPKGRLDAMSVRGAHQGVILQVEPYPYAELEDIVQASGDGDALVVVLDHVTDEGNLGAIARTCEVVGAAGLVIAKARAAGVGLGAYKTSAGAVAHLPIARVPNLAKAVERLQEAGFWACASTEHATQDLWQAPMGGRLCLVMGSEGDGVSRLVQQTCDFSAKLPQRGRIESLNVAQATTVMAYEWVRRSWGAAEDAPQDLMEGAGYDGE